MKSFSGILYSALACLAGISAGSLRAEAVRPAPLFSDHAVLQRDRPVPVWGRAAPGEEITVSIAGLQEKTRADLNGDWLVTLPPLPGPGPFDLSISAYAERVVLRDILAGEVWLCSGQSNMQWSVDKARDGPEEIRNASHPTIRLFDVPRVAAAAPGDPGAGGRWTGCTPETIGDFSAVAYFFGRELSRKLGCPVGLIHASWGGTKAQVWTPEDALRASPAFAEILRAEDARLTGLPQARETYLEERLAWEKRRLAPAGSAGAVPLPPTRASRAGLGHLYNAMIHPLIPAAVRGIAWYQGESNRDDPQEYGQLLPTMIKAWRQAWHDRAPAVAAPLPFLIVQLANNGPPSDDPAKPGTWPAVREVQRRVARDLPDTSLVVTIDIGETTSIHPLNKQEVGRRLALRALSDVYRRPGTGGGPCFKSAHIDGDEVIVEFDDLGGGLVAAEGGLRGFAIAGADGLFLPAIARIEGEVVHVSSPRVTRPVAVRHLWNDNPLATLFNREGLPAGPFSTRP